MNKTLQASVVALMIGAGSVSAAPQSGSAAAPPPAVVAVVDKYFSTIAGAVSLNQISQFYSSKLKAKKDKGTDMPGGVAAEMLILGFIKSQEPTSVRITSFVQKGNRIELKLAPKVLPKELQEQAAKGDSVGFSGEMVLLQEGGAWKVHKDKWKTVTQGKMGKMTSTFGTDGDEPEKSASDSPQASESGGGSRFSSPESSDYSSVFRRKFMDNWKPSGDADTVYLIMKVLPTGMLDDVTVRSGKGTSAEAEGPIRKLVESVQPLPALPESYFGKPYAWMTFNWHGESKAISGPYFDDKLPTHILNND